jgi:hypothetical protein
MARFGLFGPCNKLLARAKLQFGPDALASLVSLAFFCVASVIFSYTLQIHDYLAHNILIGDDMLTYITAGLRVRRQVWHPADEGWLHPHLDLRPRMLRRLPQEGRKKRLSRAQL